MSRAPLIGPVLTLSAWSLATACAHHGPGHLLVVDTLTVQRDLDGSCRFNDDRPYVVGFNSLFRDSGIDRRLARRLAGTPLRDQLVIQWFGDEAPDRIELILGRELPVTLAAELVELTARLSPLPLAISSTEADGAVCQRAQAYVGAVLPTRTPPWPRARIDELLRRSSDPEAFWARVPPVDR